MRKVSKEEFERATHGLSVSSTETYYSGELVEHYGIGRGEHHRLIGWVKRYDQLKYGLDRSKPREYYLC